MRTVYATQLALSSKNGQTAPEIFLDVRCRIKRWIEEKYLRAWGTKVDVPLEAGVITPLANHQFEVQSHSVGGSELLSIEWRHIHDNDASSSWVTIVSIACYQGEVHFALQLRIVSQSTIICPVEFDLGRPRLVTELIEFYDTFIEDWPVSISVKTLTPEMIGQFVEQVLLAKSRTIPIVLISLDPWTEKPVINPDTLQKELLGLAQVAVLENKSASFLLTEAVSRELSCFNGAVRIYWPSFSVQANPFNHRLFLPDNIRSRENNSVSFNKYLFRMLVGIAVFRFNEGHVILSVKKAVADAQRTKVDALRAEIQKGAFAKEELEKQLLEAWDNLDQTAKECAQLREEIESQKARWAEYQSFMQSEQDTVSMPPNVSESDVLTVADAVIKAQLKFGKQLVFLLSAKKQANESPFFNPELVFKLFEILDELVVRWQRGKQLGATWKDYILEKGFDYKSDISQTTKQKKYICEYQGVYEEKKVTFGEHVTIGTGQDPQKCLSVHWWRDENKKVLVIGRCGKHGSNTKT